MSVCVGSGRGVLAVEGVLGIPSGPEKSHAEQFIHNRLSRNIVKPTRVCVG